MQGQRTSTGPWVLSENRTQHLENGETSCVSITVNALLHLLGASFHTEGLSLHSNLSEHNEHQSACERFEVRRHQMDNCTSQLFVQQRTDYFQRLELYVDKQLVAAYQEPVWPHLQHQHAAASKRLTVPVACVEFLENLANAQIVPYDIADSANQAQCEENDDIEAA
ncbi:MAG: hypothetical protein AB8B97_26920 [Granulosicoccus sp.]